MVAQRSRTSISVDDYEKMIRDGVLTENSKVELIHGEIVPKMSVGDPHIACINRLNRLFMRALGDLAIVSIQNPIMLADSEPEPDVALLVPKDDDYETGKARPADIFLVIEVADSSLDYDRDVKGPLYAENSITEYWIVNLIDRSLEVHRDPQRDGTYADVRTLRAGDKIDVAALPTVSVNVSDLF